MLGMEISSRATSIGISSSTPGAADGHLHRRVLRPAQLAHGLIARPALRVLAVDPGDHVTAADALLVGGRAFEQRLHRDVLVDDLDRDPEAVVAAFLPFAELRELLRVHETRVGIERLQHAADGPVDQLIGLDLLHVARLDRVERRGEGLVLLRAGGLRARPHRGPARRREGQRRGSWRSPASGCENGAWAGS